MANYEKRSGAWRARIFVNGQRESGTFKTKTEAVGWATRREAELVGGRLPDKSVRDAFRKYASEVSPTHKGERWELVRLAMLEGFDLSRVRLDRIKPADVATWRDARLQSVSAGTVAREMNLIKSVMEVARKEWGWLHVNPMTDVKRPSSPPSRKRRIPADEIDRLTAGFGLSAGLVADTATQRTGLAFLFALETAMRAGEILGLRPEDIRAKSAILPHTKNGDAREVPLSKRAREILSVLQHGAPTVFDLDGALRDALFRKVRNQCQISNLRFHDSRAEAIWRLSKKLDVMELARAIGHRDLRSLLIYYQTTADELADKLD